MRKMILALAILYPAAAFAQGTRPRQPSTDGRRQAAGCGWVEEAAAGKKRKRKATSVAQKLQACQDIDDATKERLTCYDAI